MQPGLVLGSEVELEQAVPVAPAVLIVLAPWLGSAVVASVVVIAAGLEAAVLAAVVYSASDFALVSAVAGVQRQAVVVG